VQADVSNVAELMDWTFPQLTAFVAMFFVGRDRFAGDTICAAQR